MIRHSGRQVRDVRAGKRRVVRVMHGDRVVWQRVAGPYLRVSPVQLWLTEDVPVADAMVLANVEWSAAVESGGAQAPALLTVAPLEVELPQEGIVTAQVCCPGGWEVRDG